MGLGYGFRAWGPPAAPPFVPAAEPCCRPLDDEPAHRERRVPDVRVPAFRWRSTRCSSLSATAAAFEPACSESSAAMPWRPTSFIGSSPARSSLTCPMTTPGWYVAAGFGSISRSTTCSSSEPRKEGVFLRLENVFNQNRVFTTYIFVLQFKGACPLRPHCICLGLMSQLPVAFSLERLRQRRFRNLRLALSAPCVGTFELLYHLALGEFQRDSRRRLRPSFGQSLTSPGPLSFLSHSDRGLASMSHRSSRDP